MKNFNQAFKSLSLFLIGTLFSSNLSFAYTGDIEYLSTDEYFDVAVQEMKEAKESIVVFMYLVSVSPLRPKTKPYLLLQELVEAHKRGVKVEVVLDQNIEFLGGSLTEKQLKKSKNFEAYEILTSAGIPTFFDSPSNYSHSKVVVIDKEIVLLGSANWSAVALSRNFESNIRVQSKEFSEEVLTDLSQILRQESKLIPTKHVPISWDFFNKENLLGEMVTSSDERAFDLYLYILKEYDGNAESKVNLQYDLAQAVLGMEHMDKVDYRRQINKTLKKLEEEYKLIEVTLNRNDDAQILLKSYSSSESNYQIPDRNYIDIPHSYWTYNWSKNLDFASKVFYILSTGYSSMAKKPPLWYMSQDKLSEKHHVSKWFISKGVMGLRDLNLLEVEYDEVTPENLSQRLANNYIPSPLYNPERLKEQFKSIETEYGKDRSDRFRKILELVHEPNDPNALVALLELEDQHGEQLINDAVAVIQSKDDTSPKRSIAYLIGTIQNMAKSKNAPTTN